VWGEPFPLADKGSPSMRKASPPMSRRLPLAGVDFTPVDEMVWNAARRLACLVVGVLALVGTLLVRDAVLHRGGLFAELCAGLAAYLVVGALVAIVRARRFLLARVEDPLPTLEGPYRQNARVPVQEPECADATRLAAGALAALAIAGAFVVVAAASR
jgi:hypothetical protein